jgi:enoyl-CoA hydratase/carnithine racemase
MGYSSLLYDVDGAVATVTINRPEKRNAWSPQLTVDLIAVLDEIARERAVRATVLTGAGDRAFSAGADLGDPRTHRVDAAGSHLARAPRQGAVFDALVEHPKPLVAAVNGFAIGIGCLVTLCCDLIVASETAEFGLPQVPLGILPAYGGSVRLARHVGRAKAMEMVLLGERVTGAEAERYGMVNRCVPPDELMATARRYAERLAALPPLAVSMAKESLNRGLDLPLREAAQADVYRFTLLGQTEDSHEAHQAWREKRAPRFEGR